MANNIEKFLACLLVSGQFIENALAQLATLRTLDTATGINLDVIGAIVGQPRNGMDDDDYRRYCRVRILVHRSNGTADELIKITKLILEISTTGKVFVRTIDNATFILEVRDHAVDDPTARVLQQLLVAATAAGVRIVIVSSSVPVADTFRFDVGPGFDVGKLARGTDYTSTI